jgi:hypothetical protein
MTEVQTRVQSKFFLNLGICTPCGSQLRWRIVLDEIELEEEQRLRVIQNSQSGLDDSFQSAAVLVVTRLLVTHRQDFDPNTQ